MILLGKIRVDIPDNVEKYFRRAVVERIPFKKGALSNAATRAFIMWITGGEPWLYMNSRMGIEVRPEKLLDVILSIIDTICREKIKVHFVCSNEKANLLKAIYPDIKINEEIEIELHVKDAKEFFKKLSIIEKLDELQELFIEFDNGDIYLISSGGGCLFLNADTMPLEKKKEIVAQILKIHGRTKDYRKNKDKIKGNFHILILYEGGPMEVKVDE